MARTFTRASSHRLLLGTGQGPTFGPSTLAVIARKATDPAAYAVPISFGQADGSAWFLWTQASTDLKVWNGTVDVAAAFGWAASDGWCLVAVTKASGTATPRFHKYVYATNTWTHSDGLSTAANRTPSVSAQIGCEQDAIGSFNGYFDGDIEMAAAYPVVLTDAQIEALAFALPAWYQGNPSLLVKLDQSAVAQKAVDLSGHGFNESAINGTTVATSSVPVFNYSDGVWIPILKPAAGGGPWTIAVGQAVETDDAQPIAKLKTLTAGQTLETDLAQPVAKQKSRAVGQALETDVAQPVAKKKLRLAAQSSEADTAQPVAKLKSRTAGQPSEADLAQPIAKLKTRTAGQALEADTAQPVAKLKARSSTQAVETDVAFVVTPVKSGGGGHTIVVGQALETDTATTVARLKKRTTVQPLEAATALPVGRSKARNLGQALETSTAQPTGKKKLRIVMQASELGAALPIGATPAAETLTGYGTRALGGAAGGTRARAGASSGTRAAGGIATGVRSAP